MKSAPLLLLLASAVLFLLGLLMLLLAGESDVGVATSVVFVGLSAVALSYFLWSLHQEDGKRNPGEFLQEITKPLVVLFALLGAALALQGLGALAGLDGLRFVGSTLAELFGGF